MPDGSDDEDDAAAAQGWIYEFGWVTFDWNGVGSWKVVSACPRLDWEHTHDCFDFPRTSSQLIQLSVFQTSEQFILKNGLITQRERTSNLRHVGLLLTLTKT